METKEFSESITQTLLEHAAEIARSCGAVAVFVYVEALVGGSLALPDDFDCNVFCVTKSEAGEQTQAPQGKFFLRVPDVPLSRLDQMKVAVFFALSRGLISPDDVAVANVSSRWAKLVWSAAAAADSRVLAAADWVVPASSAW